MAKYLDPPHFHPKFYLTKMTQNGLKWILNTTLKIVTFCRRDPPPPIVTFVTIFFFFNEGFPNLYGFHDNMSGSKLFVLCGAGLWFVAFRNV